ncbi:diguanylate cyclase [Tumebacillus sp. ITR2]|uniref:Diguanylate cyclase n=1 Tax=Tumebacillus amylolyticus TaxID=2801339 RepID=A0ABS1JD06_9BACL|nr:diguanylate cyclase [Tumebacillus amylolyticus]MBL0388151.1 diguanylate cyclase [Tumebacillus amylolyticus]
MKTSLRLYVYTINIIGLALLAFTLTMFPHGVLFDALVFLVLAGVVQLMPVALAKQSWVSVSFSIAYAAVLLLGPEVGALTSMVIGLVASFYPKRLKPHKLIFNVAGLAIPAYISGQILQMAQGMSYFWLLEFIFVPLLFYTINSALITFAIALTANESPFRIWNENYRWPMLNYLFLAWIGIGLYKAYAVLNVLGLMIFVLPLIMARYSFKLYIDQTNKVQQHLDSLQTANDMLNRKVDEVAALQKHALLMGTSLNFESTLLTVFARVSDEVPYQALYIVWKNPDRESYEQYQIKERTGIESVTLTELDVSIDRVFQQGKRIVLSARESTHVKLLCPMIAQGNVQGVMTLLCPRDLLEEIDSSLDVYVSHGAAALSNAYLYQRMERVANTDNLTKLYNRHYFARKLSDMTKAPHVANTVIIMDFDNFKDINNTYGHHIGDLALHYVASLIRSESRDEDIPVRYGGDEFALLMPNATEEIGLIVAARLLEQIRLPVTLEGHTLSISLSFGVATCLEGDGNIQETVKQADKAAYFSKASGKGCITLYSQIQGEGHPVYQGNSEQIVPSAEEIESRRSITKGLLHALKARDVVTYNHSLQVATYSVWLAQRLHLPPDEIERVRFGALLHDIGKLGIPDQVLKKSAVLNKAEHSNMRTHPVVGHDILRHFGTVYDSILPILLSHHERMDGQGYPHGIEASTLDQAVRIVTIADAFDSMTRDSCYRDKMPMHWAVEELRRCKGTQFDSELVDQFLEVVRQHFPDRWSDSGENPDSSVVREASLQ